MCDYIKYQKLAGRHFNFELILLNFVWTITGHAFFYSEVMLIIVGILWDIVGILWDIMQLVIG